MCAQREGGREKRKREKEEEEKIATDVFNLGE